MEADKQVCTAPGWDQGPAEQGGEPDEFFCELASGHDGEHAWLTGPWPDNRKPITWARSVLIQDGITGEVTEFKVS